MPSTVVQCNDIWGNHISALLAVDIASAALSAALVAPVVTIIDRAIVEKSSVNTSLLRAFNTHALCSLRQPRRFFIGRPFFIVWWLYAATYSTANMTETVAKTALEVADKATIASAKFLSTFLVNVPLGLWKDVSFARLFGTATSRSVPSRLVPATTTSKTPIPLNRNGPSQRLPVSMRVCSAFLLRDGLTIFGSFPLAGVLSTTIPNSLALNPHAKAAIAQLVVPAMTQLVATPVHLLGLDMYNRPHAVSLSDRFVRIRRDLLSTTAARCLRIIPPFGFGCIMNAELRSLYYERLQPMIENY